jgi:glycosyltransferase involved in cell wall biosynthesis
MRIVGIGRFEPHKGFGRLIDTFARVAPQHPDWDLVIFGAGPERATLETLIRRHGLQQRVFLPGVVKDVYRELADSHLMAFPSSCEGFPNALAEALATGLPAVGREGVSGVEDLIVDGKTGVLVPGDNPDLLAAALARLMDDPRRRRELGRAAIAHVARWAPPKILELWEAALAQATGTLAPRRMRNAAE